MPPAPSNEFLGCHYWTESDWVADHHADGRLWTWEQLPLSLWPVRAARTWGKSLLSEAPGRKTGFREYIRSRKTEGKNRPGLRAGRSKRQQSQDQVKADGLSKKPSRKKNQFLKGVSMSWIPLSEKPLLSWGMNSWGLCSEVTGVPVWNREDYRQPYSCKWGRMTDVTLSAQITQSGQEPTRAV